jgi:hypothetical protein
MLDPPSSVAYTMDDEAAVRYESRLAIDIREFVGSSVPSFRVLGWTEDIEDGPEDGELEGGVAGRTG